MDITLVIDIGLVHREKLVGFVLGHDLVKIIPHRLEEFFGISRIFEFIIQEKEILQRIRIDCVLFEIILRGICFKLALAKIDPDVLHTDF